MQGHAEEGEEGTEEDEGEMVEAEREEVVGELGIELLLLEVEGELLIVAALV